MSPGVCVCGGVTSTEDGWLGGGPGGLRLLLFPSLRRGFGRWGQAQHPAPIKEGPTLSLLPSPPSRATGKGSSGSCLFLESVRWLGKEVSLVKRDLTVGHCKFEGLRRRERWAFPLHLPQSWSSAQPSWRGLCQEQGVPTQGGRAPQAGGRAEALESPLASSSALEGGLAPGPREGARRQWGSGWGALETCSLYPASQRSPGRGRLSRQAPVSGAGCPLGCQDASGLCSEQSL